MREVNRMTEWSYKELVKNPSDYYQYDFELFPHELTDFEKKLSKLEQVRYIENPKRFFKETAYYKRIDGKLSHYAQISKLKSNAFNRGSGYLTHSFSFYHGSFHAQMVRALINYCNLKDNSVILDTFMGSGTTLVESTILGFNSIGIDINPFACLMSKIKAQILEIPVNILLADNRKYFDITYYNKFLDYEFNEILDLRIKDLFYLFVYLSSLIDVKRFSTNISDAFTRNFMNKIRTLKFFEQLKNKIDFNLGKSRVLFGDNVEILKKFKTHSINCIITSPPYLDLIDYIQEDITPISQFFNNSSIHKLKKNSIGFKQKSREQTKKEYFSKMNKVYRESYRVLKPNTHYIVIIGTYDNLKEMYIKLAEANNFHIDRIMLKESVSRKKRKNYEYIFFLRKEL
jgi:DNA modification methylase